MSERLQGNQEEAFCDLSGTLRHHVLLCFLCFFVVERQRPKSGNIAKTSKLVVSERLGLNANVFISREISLFSCGPLVRGMPPSARKFVNPSV